MDFSSLKQTDVINFKISQEYDTVRRSICRCYQFHGQIKDSMGICLESLAIVMKEYAALLKCIAQFLVYVMAYTYAFLYIAYIIQSQVT